MQLGILKKLDNVIIARLGYNFTTGTGLAFEGEFAASFLLPMGDALIGHPTKHRKHPGMTVMWFWLDWYSHWYHSLGLPRPKLIALGHSHKSAQMRLHGDHLYLAEIGVMGYPGACQGWAFDIRVAAPPAAMGSLYFEQTRIDGKWVTDLREIYYRPALLPSVDVV